MRGGWPNATLFLVFFDEWKHPPPFPKNAKGSFRGSGGGWFLTRSTPIFTILYATPCLLLLFLYIYYDLYTSLYLPLPLIYELLTTISPNQYPRNR